MEKNTVVVLCVILAAVRAYDGVDIGQFQQTLPQLQGYHQPHTYGGAKQPYQRHRKPHIPLNNHEQPEDLFKLEAYLTSDGGEVQGEVEAFTRLQARPYIDPNYANRPLSRTDEPYRETLSPNPSLFSVADIGQFQQALPQLQVYHQPHTYGGAKQPYESHRKPQNPLNNHEEPEDLFKLEAYLTSDGGEVQGEVEAFTRLQARPYIEPNYDNRPLSRTDEPYRETLSRNPSLLRSLVPFSKGISMPHIFWPSFIPIQKLLPKNIMNELIAAILQEVMIQQIKYGLVESHESPQELGSMGKRATSKVGIIATKLIVHQVVRAVMFSYLGPLGVIVAEESLFALGEYITKKVIKRMKRQ